MLISPSFSQDNRYPATGVMFTGKSPRNRAEKWVKNNPARTTEIKKTYSFPSYKNVINTMVDQLKRYTGVSSEDIAFKLERKRSSESLKEDVGDNSGTW